MKGTNVFELNHETLCEAVQLWVDKHFRDPSPGVSSVIADKQLNSGSTFKVTVKERMMPFVEEGEGETDDRVGGL